MLYNLCHVMLFDKTSVMLYYNIVISCYINMCHVMLCYITYVMLYNIWSFHVITYVVMLCYITCRVMLCYITYVI